MKIKTQDLKAEDRTLDWAVALIEKPGIVGVRPDGKLGAVGNKAFSPSTNWAQGGPIIDRLMRDGLKLSGNTALPSDPTSCQAQINAIVSAGPTPLIAALRCYVEFKLGPEVEVPDMLVPHLVAQRSAEQEATIQNKSIDRPRG